MKNIFLAPRSNETAYKNYISSMQGKDFADIAPYLTDDEKYQLAGDSKYFAWGCQPSLRSKWDNLQHGDYVMFYAHGRFISVGTLKFKKYSEDLALSLWPRSEETDKPWSCVFFVENIRDINLGIEEFDNITGYKLKSIMGFMKISRESALENIAARYGSTDGFVRFLTTGISDGEVTEVVTISTKPAKDVTNEDIARLDEITRDHSSEDIEAIIKNLAQTQRDQTPEKIMRTVNLFKRSAKLVKVMKEKHGDKCQICGFTFRTAAGYYYSEAAHVNAISTGEVGVDSPDNIWILCANHHKMLDRGAIIAVGRNEYKFLDGGMLYELLES